MKIKVLLAKYLAWAVLAVLAAVLAFVYLRTGPEAGFTKLKEEIGKHEIAVRRVMDDNNPVPEKPTTNYVGALKTRLEHPAELDRFRHNPFVNNAVVEWPTIQIGKGKTQEVIVPGVRLTEVVDAPETHVKIVLTDDGKKIKWIPEKETSVITFQAIEKGSAAFQVLTMDEVVSYHFTLSVSEKPVADPPLPPVDVTIVPRGVKESRGKRERALVLVVFLPDGHAPELGKIGASNRAAIYRKSANAGDAEYVLLKQIARAKAAELQAIWRRFYPEEEARRDVAPPPKPAQAGDAPVPEAVTNAAPPRPADAGRAATTRPQSGKAFVYLDDTVEEGESYTYKIVTLNEQPGLDTSECKAPYISPLPVNVPSLVDFTVASAGGGRARLVLTRLDPDNERQPISWTGTFTVGMKIGGIVPGRLTTPKAVGNKDVDFSTGYTLVDTLGTYKDINGTSLKLLTKATPQVFAAKYRLVLDQAVLYLTPVGNALRLKSKSDSIAAPSGPLPAAVAPGAMPGMPGM